MTLNINKCLQRVTIFATFVGFFIVLMKTLKVIVSKAGKGISAHIQEVEGYVISRSSVEKLKRDLPSGLLFHIEGLYEEKYFIGLRKYTASLPLRLVQWHSLRRVWRFPGN